MNRKDNYVDLIKKRLLNLGKRLTVDAERIIAENKDKINPSDLIKNLLEIEDIFVSKKTIEKILERREPVVKREFKYNINILLNVGEEVQQGVGLKEIKSYFTDRYNTLGNEIAKDYRINSVIDISKISFNEGENYIIGLVYNKSITKQSVYLEIEDNTGKRRFYIDRRDEYLNKIVRILPLDVVVGARILCRRDKPPLILEIYLPKVIPPKDRPKKDIYVILTSDLHIGSNKFQYELFDNFIELLHGNVDNYKLQNIVYNTYYMIVAGDIIEGIGVFPRQEKELIITDPKKQYKEAYKLLSKVPKEIKIIIIPGNHDTTRKALPRPPILKDYAPYFYTDNRFIMLGEPVNISLHGVKIYSFHGDFINDILSTTPGLTLDNTIDAMDIMLLSRHIAPTYGLQTKIAPQLKDNLIIPREVNIIHAGHVHKFCSRYRYDNQILLINSGTWQEQTEYQREMGVTPTPGLIPFINLRNLKVNLVDLSK